MSRDRRLAVTARAPGLGLTVDYTSTVVPPTSATSSRGPKPVTRVTPPTGLRPLSRWERARREGLPTTIAQFGGMALFGFFFLVLALQGAGPIAWGFAVLLLSPVPICLLAVALLHLRTPRNVAPPRASAVGASARDEKGRFVARHLGG